MIKLLYLLFVFFLILFSFNILLAQEEKETILSNRCKVFGGLSVPVGDFSSTSGDNRGAALTGFNAGIGFDFEIEKALELGLIGDISVNSIDETEIEKQLKNSLYYEYGYTGQSSLSTSPWITFDVMSNIGFNVHLSPKVSLYGKGYVGALIGIFPEVKFKLIDLNATVTQNSATAVSIGYGVGGGIIINNKFDLEIKYLTGEPEYKTKESLDVPPYPSLDLKFKQPSGRVLFDVGYIIDLSTND